jgi:hypothetical protein
MEPVWPIPALYPGPRGWFVYARLAFMPAFYAPRSRSTAGDDGTLAPANHRLISARYREVMHAACER